MSLQEIREKTVETLKTYFVEDAQEIISEIESSLRNPDITSNSAQSEELKIYLALMNFIAFSTLPEPDQLELFRTFLVKAFRVGIDIENRFAIKMDLTPDVLWPETVQSFVEAMLKNNERLGGQTILVRGEKVETSPILSNWLRDYNRIYGMDRHEKIIPHRYLSENPNIHRLNKEEQALLLKILEFYEGLKFPSQEQIQRSLEKALDQYIAENNELPEEFEENNQEVDVVEDVRERLRIDSNEIIDNDIETLIRQYPKVSDQIISSQPIKLLFNEEIVQPTISNWLADYRAYVGIGKHEINERSDYLLRSQNVQNINPEERERLGLLLRSYDEHYLLPFSISKQQIVFEKVRSS